MTASQVAPATPAPRVGPNHLLSAYAVVTVAGIIAAAIALFVVGVSAAWILAPLGMVPINACAPLPSALPIAGLACGVVHLAVTSLLPAHRWLHFAGFVAISTIVASAFQLGTVAGAPPGWTGCALASSAAMSALFPGTVIAVVYAATRSTSASVSNAGSATSLLLAALALVLTWRYAVIDVPNALVAALLGVMLIGLSALTVVAWRVGIRPRWDRPAWFQATGIALMGGIVVAGAGVIAFATGLR